MFLRKGPLLVKFDDLAIFRWPGAVFTARHHASAVYTGFIFATKMQTITEKRQHRLSLHVTPFSYHAEQQYLTFSTN